MLSKQTFGSFNCCDLKYGREKGSTQNKNELKQPLAFAKKYSSCYFRGDLGKSMYGYVGIVMVCNPTHAQPDYNNNLHYPKTVQTTIALHMQGAATGSGRLYASHAPRVEWPWWRRGECAWSGRGCAETAYSGEPRTSSEQHYADLLNRD